jgi:hypothetical protein
VTKKRIAEQLRIAAPLLVVGGAVAAGFLLGPSYSVLVLAAAAMVAAIALLWTSVRALFGETPLDTEEAYALGTPSAEEEQKRAVLRAIKDLEFERSVGKISDEDYAVLVERFRAEAKRLLRILDERSRPERAQAEETVRQYLEREGLLDVPAKAPQAEKSDEDGEEARA